MLVKTGMLSISSDDVMATYCASSSQTSQYPEIPSRNTSQTSGSPATHENYCFARYVSRENSLTMCSNIVTIAASEA